LTVPDFELDLLRAECERLRLIQAIGREFASSLDFEELLPKVFNRVLNAVHAQGGSLWITEGEVLRCRLALGASSQKLVGKEVPVGEGFVGDVARKQRSTIVADAMQDPRFQERVDRSSTMITTTVLAAPMLAEGESIGAIQVLNKYGDDIFDDNDRELLEGLAAAAAIALRNARLHAAEKRARDLATLLEISREITSTLDLDRILRSVVNLAVRAFPFEQGAVGMVAKGRVDLRAMTGKEAVPADDPAVRRLTERCEWALGRGATCYVADVTAPATDDARAFAGAFAETMAADELRAGLYLPLMDEEGTLGILAFESTTPDFAGETQQELAAILANQTTVALRNAQLYNQVPLADMLGALASKKKRWMALPKRRRQVIVGVAAVVIAAATLIRWPYRVSGELPTFRAASYADVRPLVSGLVERVMVTEGAPVQRGEPVLQLRATDLQAQRDLAQADLVAAERAAAAADARGDAGTAHIQRAIADARRGSLRVLDGELAAATVRSPVDGIVLSPRPENLLGVQLQAGDRALVVGRVDSLELDFDVSGTDVDRVHVGQTVRLRVDALPQRTFEGRVIFLAPEPADSGGSGAFPVRAMVANRDGVLRAGMQAHAKVLTASASSVYRVFRAPVRWLRILWWRMVS